jgi:hypothetical protein
MTLAMSVYVKPRLKLFLTRNLSSKSSQNQCVYAVPLGQHSLSAGVRKELTPSTRSIAHRRSPSEAQASPLLGGTSVRFVNVAQLQEVMQCVRVERSQNGSAFRRTAFFPRDVSATSCFI